MFLMKKMNAETGEGAGGGAPPPVPEPVQPAAPPAPEPVTQPPQPDWSARLAAMEQQNQQLMQLLAMQQQQRAVPQVAQTPEPVDESQLDPMFVKYIQQRDSQWERRLNSLRETVDQTMFQTTVAGKQLPPEAMQVAEAVYTQWRNSGTLVRMPDGSMAPPTRQDALRFALGDLALQGKLGGQQAKPPIAGGPMRPAAPAPAAATRDLSQMSRAERIAAYEAALDVDGF